MSGGDEKNDAKLVADSLVHSKPHPPDASDSPPSYNRYISFGNIQNERYSLSSQPSSDHDNEDVFMFHSNKYSLCMCVLDGHDGSHAVKFVKKYMNQHVFGKLAWDDVMKSNKPEKIIAALANCIQEIDNNFFISINPFTMERQRLQSVIPKVSIAVTCT